MRKEQKEILSLFKTQTSLSRFRELHDCIEQNKVTRFEVLLSDKNKISALLNQLSLSYSWSDIIFKPTTDEGMDTWSSSLQICSSEDDSAMSFVYVHEDKEKCIEAEILESGADDFSLGILLGYPKCCVEAYTKWLHSNNATDPISIIATEAEFLTEIKTITFPNPFTRYIGSGLFSHFPCSLSCDQTILIANKTLSSLRVNFPETASMIESFEKALVLFKLGKGVCMWTQYHRHHNTLSINSKTLFGQGDLHRLCQSVDKIEITDSTIDLYSTDKVIKQLSNKNLFLHSFN